VEITKEQFVEQFDSCMTFIDSLWERTHKMHS
jgi:hypothetical protein